MEQKQHPSRKGLTTLLLAPCLLILATGARSSASAETLSLDSAPPVVLGTIPPAGSTEVDPGLTELKVTFSKEMMDGNWSWSTWGEENFPETTGKPYYLADKRTCVLPVKLQPGKFYASWLNSQKFGNFKDSTGQSAVPYLLAFQTAGDPTGAQAPQVPLEDFGPLDDDQKLFLTWTDRQFKGFFDRRSFNGWSEQDRAALERKLLDALKGPVNREYYQAIGSLGALQSKAALQPLLQIAADRTEKDNRDRWMAIRALALIGEKSVVPSLIHLVYHGNLNTRWWAQLALVKLTGQNFGKDWNMWGTWWNNSGGQPKFNPEMITWYKAPEFSEPTALQKTIHDADAKFLGELREAVQKRGGSL